MILAHLKARSFKRARDGNNRSPPPGQTLLMQIPAEFVNLTSVFAQHLQQEFPYVTGVRGDGKREVRRENPTLPDWHLIRACRGFTCIDKGGGLGS